MLAVPRVTRSDARIPCREGVFDIVGVQNLGPAKRGRLAVCHPNELQERIAHVDVLTLGVADPDAVVDRFADGAIELLAGLESTRARLHLIEHVIECVDDYSDLIVSGLDGAKRVVALLDYLPRCVGHGFHGLTHRALQPARGKDGGDQPDQHGGTNDREICPHRPRYVVVRSQVDRPKEFATLNYSFHQLDASARDLHPRLECGYASGCCRVSRSGICREKGTVRRIERRRLDGRARLKRVEIPFSAFNVLKRKGGLHCE